MEVHAGDSLEPSWVNGWLPGLDGAAIYSFLRERRPSLYLEIGSGNSTLFAARARRDGDLPTAIVSIDPQPREDIDGMCDEIYRIRRLPARRRPTLLLMSCTATSTPAGSRGRS
jgi:hypothetical protein